MKPEYFQHWLLFVHALCIFCFKILSLLKIFQGQKLCYKCFVVILQNCTGLKTIPIMYTMFYILHQLSEDMDPCGAMPHFNGRALMVF